MHLIINHVMQLDHVDHTDRGFLMEAFTGFSVIQISVTVSWNAGLLAIISNFINRSSVKNWCRESYSQFFSSPTENSFIDLSKVHTARHAKRIQYNINRSSIFKEWHVFFANNLSHNSFVTMATCHFISHF